MIVPVDQSSELHFRAKMFQDKDFIGYAAEERKSDSAITGPQVYSTGETTAPKISTTSLSWAQLWDTCRDSTLIVYHHMVVSGKMDPKFCSKVPARVFC